MNPAESTYSDLISKHADFLSHPQAQADIKKAREISAKLRPSRKWQPMKLVPFTTPDGAACYENNIYSSTVRRHAQGWAFGGGPWVEIGIYCPDGEARHDFRDMQCIKNDICGPEWEAIELFPAESRLLDPSNYYTMWCAPTINIGRFVPRTIATPETCIAPQRGWSK
jgi:hypothetical protein